MIHFFKRLFARKTAEPKLEIGDTVKTYQDGKFHKKGIVIDRKIKYTDPSQHFDMFGSYADSQLRYIKLYEEILEVLEKRPNIKTERAGFVEIVKDLKKNIRKGARRISNKHKRWEHAIMVGNNEVITVREENIKQYRIPLAEKTRLSIPKYYL